MDIMNVGIDISKALAISGWMSSAELTWLARQAKKRFVIVEIGSYMGRSTRALVDNTPGYVIAIDDWKGPRDIECDRNDLLSKFLTNMRDVAHKIQYIQADYDEVYTLPSVSMIKPDMVFIDGDHTYPFAKRDISFWAKELLIDGLLCGHDFLSFPDVAKAVRELLPGHRLVMDTDIWCWVKTIDYHNSTGYTSDK